MKRPPPPRPPGPLDRSDAAPPVRILLIDDEQDMLNLLHYNLGGHGFEVSSAANGFYGLALAHDRRPDLIVLDLTMPGVDGFEVCRNLRRHWSTQHIPVLILSARGTENDRMSGFRSGADDYVVKPFELRELIARIDALLRRSGRVEDAPSLTGLPGVRALRGALSDMLAARARFAALHVRIEHLDIAARRGFDCADRLILQAAGSLREETAAYGPGPRFVAQAGVGAFMALCRPEFAPAIARETCRQFRLAVNDALPPLRAADGAPSETGRRPCLAVAGVVETGGQFSESDDVADALALVRTELDALGAGNRCIIRA